VPAGGVLLAGTRKVLLFVILFVESIFVHAQKTDGVNNAENEAKRSNDQIQNTQAHLTQVKAV